MQSRRINGQKWVVAEDIFTRPIFNHFSELKLIADRWKSTLQANKSITIVNDYHFNLKEVIFLFQLP